MNPPRGATQISVLVPVTDPEYPLDLLYTDFARPLKDHGVEFEFLFLAQEHDRPRLRQLRALRAAGEPIRILVSGHAPEGAVAAIGAQETTSPVVMTLPSYPRIAPDALPELIRFVDRPGVDMVTAVRVNDRDSWLNRLQRKSFHLLLRKMVGGRFRDVASGVRVMRREVLEGLDLYGDFFRFLPMLAYRDGFQVEELEVRAHEDDRKNRVYVPGVYLRRVVDLVGMMFLVRFTYKPLRFFGLVGTGLAGIGAAVLLVLLFQRIGGTGIADRPLLLLGVLLVVVGLQALAIGLIGEIIVHHNVAKRPLYRLREAPDAEPDGSDSSGPYPQRDADA